MSQAATDSDVSQRKKRSNAEKSIPITDLEYSSSHGQEMDKRDSDDCSQERELSEEKSPKENTVSSNAEDVPSENKTGVADTASVPPEEDYNPSESKVVGHESDTKVPKDEDPNISTLSMGEVISEETSAPFDVEVGLPKECDEDANDEDNSEYLGSLGYHNHSVSACSLGESQRFRRRSTLASVESMEHVCPICLGSYEEGTMLFVSKECSHIFHSECILEWLTKHEDCPICRVKMVTEDEMVKAAMALVNKTTK